MLVQAKSLQSLQQKTEPDKGFCSGTFLSSDVFITAAHCLNEKANMIGLFRNDSPRKLFISCPGEKYFSTEASILHESYIGPINKNSLGELEFQNSWSSGIDQNADIAAVVVSNGPEGPFPKLPDVTPIQNCNLLGYSPYKCDQETGAGCARQVNIDLGTLTNTPRINSRIQNLIERGDSGSGLVCGDQFIGVNVSVDNNTDHFEFINVSYYQDFVRSFLSSSKSELLTRAEQTKISKASWEIFLQNVAIKNQNTGLTYICFEKDSDCLEIYKLFSSISKDKKVVSIIKNLGAKTLFYSNGLKNLQGTDPVVLNKINKDVIYVSKDAKLSDFLKPIPER